MKRSKFYTLARNATRFFLLKICRMEIIGEENLENWKSGILASNHMSYLDPPLLGSVSTVPIHFVAKKELFQIPVLGYIIRQLNAFPIRRGTIDRKALTHMAGLIEDGESVLIFPEGSRKNFSARPGIGKVAVTTQSPVLPIRIENSNRLLSVIFGKRKLKVFIGKPVQPVQVKDTDNVKDIYREYSKNILNLINSLGK